MKIMLWLQIFVLAASQVLESNAVYFYGEENVLLGK